MNSLFNRDQAAAGPTLVDLLVQQAQRTPDRVAVVFGQHGLTYRQLDEQSNQLAHHLIRLGVHEETLVPVCLHRSLSMIVSLLGILKAGGAYVPIDPDYPAERIRYILSDVNGPVVLVDEAAKAKLQNLNPEATLLSIDGEWDRIAQAATELPQTGLTPAHAAYVIYTSGSTGQPKGVIIEHRNVVRLFFTDSPLFHFGPDDVWTLFHSFCFDFSVWEMYGALLFGGKLVVVPQSVTKDAQQFGDLLHQEGVTVLNQTPSAFYALQEQVVGHIDSLPLRYVIFGGEALHPARLKPWFKAYPGCALINMYGITETTVHVTYLALTSAHIVDEVSGNAGSPIGVPIPTLTTYILNPDGHEVGVGEVGELYVGGAGLARGYLNRPALTAQRFIVNPFGTEPGDRLYRSGDLALRLPDGNMVYQGRIDEQVKIRGFRIELGEIETALLQYPGVQQAVVLAREDARGDKRLIGYVVMPIGFDRVAIRAFLQTRLPAYMVPALLLPVEAIPLTRNGKVDRRALPNPDASELLSSAYAAPQTQIQENLITVWKEVLQVGRVGIHDNFFELGGNSLLAIKTVTTLAQTYAYDFSVTKLYQYPTVEALADFLNGSSKPSLRTRSRKPRLADDTDIAVIGMAGRFPGASSPEALWQVVVNGQETIRFFADQELDPSLPDTLTLDPAYVKARGILEQADQFDAEFFNLNGKLAEVMDPQQRVFLEIVWEVLEKTGHLPSHFDGEIGLWAGCGNNTYYLNNILTNPEVLNQVGAFQAMTVNEKDFIASRTAYQLNLKGPAVSVYSACSSSLLAITQAVDSLRLGQCDVAVAGGASVTAPINSGHLYEEGAMLSRDGHCRPFDAEASGTVFSDGAGVVLLKRLVDAQQDGDTIYAVIKGVGVNNDGGGKGSFTAPSAEGQAVAIRKALDDAKVDPATISYVEAHGTATPLGDPIELEGLNLAFGQTDRKQYCAIGSIKSNLGHLTAAAGVAGFIKTTLALHHRQLPPSIGYRQPNPIIDFSGSPFYVNNSLQPWLTGEPGLEPTKPAQPRRAGVSSFGVGGTNVHTILEEYAPVPTVEIEELDKPTRRAQLVCWSAKSEASLNAYPDELATTLLQADAPGLTDVAYTLQTTRPPFDFRRFVVADSAEELVQQLRTETADPLSTVAESPGELVFMFPGQGAQYLNMGHELYQTEPVYRDAVDKCAEYLHGLLDVDIRTVLFALDNEEAQVRLKNTRYTQPALFTTEYALAQLWMSWGIAPTLFCGHSIGEFVAAHLAGVFSLPDALTLIATRGRLISELPSGRMLSVRLDSEKLQFMLPPGLSIAAVNSPQQCVVAGPAEVVERLATLLDRRQIPNRMLETSHAFHSAMMDPAVASFASTVGQVSLQNPRKPIVSTVTGTWLTDAEATDPMYWATHMRLPVQFARALRTLAEVPNALLLEVGPGTVSTALARQQGLEKPLRVVASIEAQAGRGSESRAILNALGTLWTWGVTPNWTGLYAGSSPKKVLLPTYAFNRKRCWVDPVSASLLVNTGSLQANKPPQADLTHSTTSMSTPSSRIEALLAIVRTLLTETAGVNSGNVGLTSRFLDLGLDSLALTQLSFQLRKKFDLPISFRQLSAEYNTLEKLLAYLDSKLPADAYRPVVPKPAEVTSPNRVALPVIQPDIAPVSLPVNNAGVASTSVVHGLTDAPSVVNLFAQQIQILNQQLVILQGGAIANSAPAPTQFTPSPAEVPPTPEPVTVTKAFGAGARIERHITALSDSQKRFLHEHVERYNQKTASSKAHTQQYRPWMADPRAVTGFKPLTKEIVYPIVVDKSLGSRLWDIDGNEYIDVLSGFGSILFGHRPDFLNKVLHEQLDKGYEIGPQHRLAGEVCQMICSFTGFERAALCNTGSEAVLAAIRMARTVTGRSLVVVFTGSYHGIFDEVIARAGSSQQSYPAALGIPSEAVQNLLILDYGTDESLAIIRKRANELAAVLVEPVQSRRSEFQPVEFLKKVREVTMESGTALIFDEVITGFRMHPAGAQGLFGIQADLASYGKVVGGGLPIGVVAGKAAFMDALDGGFWNYGDASYPEADITFYAGTFVRHPLALAAAKASLTYMQKQGPALQQRLTDKARRLVEAMNQFLTENRLPLLVAQFGSLWRIKFTEDVPYSELLFTLMRERGIHIWDGFPCFMTEAHTSDDIDRVLDAFTQSLQDLADAEFLPNITVRRKGKSTPPVTGARLGRDESGNPAWFVPDPERPTKFLQIISN
ncbi:amino acid adenylation domain-containing protein [Rudanella paleaurantiibacter]|uniref:Amino acid adenylation domain-containing protein n=1 Tax=Rudanella paleaurantiibacter TaxID=2614655 RepID=A0A7J5TTW9_9BACT|nr:polyketide synthase [Rudanella paleaurantiibacter]KAB7727340.1 amino acid adenylation domain-containing protein [Rudanella paleaurantiibacter]